MGRNYGEIAATIRDAIESDMLRDGYACFVGTYDFEDSDLLDAIAELCEIADRSIELPTGSDGKPIRAGESVCDQHGNVWRVASLTIGGDITYANCYAVGRCDGAQLNPKILTHEFKSIPDLMLAFAREYARCSDSESAKRALDNYVARIEELVDGTRDCMEDGPCRCKCGGGDA